MEQGSISGDGLEGVGPLCCGSVLSQEEERQLQTWAQGTHRIPPTQHSPKARRLHLIGCVSSDAISARHCVTYPSRLAWATLCESSFWAPPFFASRLCSWSRPPVVSLSVPSYRDLRTGTPQKLENGEWGPVPSGPQDVSWATAGALRVLSWPCLQWHWLSSGALNLPT